MSGQSINDICTKICNCEPVTRDGLHDAVILEPRVDGAPRGSLAFNKMMRAAIEYGHNYCIDMLMDMHPGFTSEPDALGFAVETYHEYRELSCITNHKQHVFNESRPCDRDEAITAEMTCHEQFIKYSDTLEWALNKYRDRTSSDTNEEFRTYRDERIKRREKFVHERDTHIVDNLLR